MLGVSRNLLHHCSASTRLRVIRVQGGAVGLCERMSDALEVLKVVVAEATVAEFAEGGGQEVVDGTIQCLTSGRHSVFVPFALFASLLLFGISVRCRRGCLWLRLRRRFRGG